MLSLLRESTFGRLCRLLSKNKVFRYPEEDDRDTWRDRYSGQQGSSTQQRTFSYDENRDHSRRVSEASSQTQAEDSSNVEHHRHSNSNAEKGNDDKVVTWYGEKDRGTLQPS